MKHDLQLLAQISASSDGGYFTSFMKNVLELFSTDRRLLETRGSLIIRQLCLHLHAERIFRTIAEILEKDDVSVCAFRRAAPTGGRGGATCDVDVPRGRGVVRRATRMYREGRGRPSSGMVLLFSRGWDGEQCGLPRADATFPPCHLCAHLSKRRRGGREYQEAWPARPQNAITPGPD